MNMSAEGQKDAVNNDRMERRNSYFSYYNFMSFEAIKFDNLNQHVSLSGSVSEARQHIFQFF